MTPVMKFKKKFYFIVASYFRFFANFAFRRWHPRVIAITGSVGKTTMLNLVECTLGDKAHYSHDANSAYGIAFDMVNLRGVTGSKLRWFYLFLAVPLKSLFYKHQEEFYVVEIDGERPHEAEFLASWLKPEVTLWISLGLSHAVQFEQQVKDGLFSSLDKAITHEFAMLPQYTQKLVIIDGEVDLMNRALDSIKQKNLTKATVIKCSKDAVKTYKVEPNHTSFILQGTADSVSHEYEFNRPMSKDIAIQLTMLETLVNYLKVKPRYDFSNLKLAPGRNSYFDGKNGLKIIDSSYNAHLISVKSILEMYKAMHVPHKWLVIGDIVDQGSIEGQEHAKLADEIIKVKPEQVILIGRRTKKYTAPILKEAGLNIYTTLDPREALKFLEQNLTGQETLLFKGSQYLEWLIEKLLKNPEEAKYLPRREKAAIKRRQKRGLN
jgi:UDP-N-acetylmuramoyl-tripeptide--D-alanyl-D-alanine ligase